MRALRAYIMQLSWLVSRVDNGGRCVLGAIAIGYAAVFAAGNPSYVEGFGPARQSAIPFAQARDFFIGITEFLLLSRRGA